MSRNCIALQAGPLTVKITVSGPNSEAFVAEIIQKLAPSPMLKRPAGPGGAIPAAEFLTATEVGRVFGISRQLAHYWETKGWLPAPVVSGGRKRWASADITAFLAAPAQDGRAWRRLRRTTGHTGSGVK